MLLLFPEDKKLGGNYILWNDTAPSICYKYHNSQYYVIPAKVEKLNYNKDYIIVMTTDINDGERKYWIIKKNEELNFEICSSSDNICFDGVLYSQRIDPLDSITFFKKVSDYEINLELKPI